MSGASIIAQAFGEGADLYTDVLGIDRKATAAQLRKAYYQKALLYHPDKQKSNDGDDAKAKFQAISVAYEILKDPEKRAEYDDSGELAEDDDFSSKAGTDMWRSYFDHIFGKVTTSDIDNFAAKYKCSEEEEQDVLKYYKKFKGNLDKMLDCVMLSNECDKKRWVEDFIQPAIDKGDVEDYSKMLKKTMKEDEDTVQDMDETETEESEEEEKTRKTKSKAKAKKSAPKKAKASKAKAKKRDKEAAEAEALMAKIRNKHSLAHRQAGFENMISGIKDRYGVQDADPLGDDKFEKIQARMVSQGKMKGRKKKTKK